MMGKLGMSLKNGNSIFTVARIIKYGNIWVAGGWGINPLAWSDDGKNWNESENGNSIFVKILL